MSKRAPTKDAITASGILATEQIGPKQSLTAAGFLLCQDVPIARIGTQEYADVELPDIEPSDDGIIVVERHEEDVFDPESIASFEGAPVTIEHPREPVTPDNWIVYAKGYACNVRRGEAEMSDFLMADLLITDKGAIHDVQTKRLREISNGYEAAYIQIAPGRARQTDIVGNHVALLAGQARCGDACSVQDSKPTSTGDPSMATKKGAESLKDKLRKLFMTRDSEAFEKALSEEVKDESEGMQNNMPDIHIHMPGAEKVGAGAGTTADADPPADPAAAPAADPMAQVMDAIKGIADSVAALGERMDKYEAGGATKDSDEEKKDETKDEESDEKNDETTDEDSDEDNPKDDVSATNDSASFRDEFQDAKARAEILAPGVKLPTFDAKADSKKTADSICVLRRRALRAALTNDNADLVRAIVGDADVSKMTCDAAKMAFHASSELVKQKNKTVARKTTDAAKEAKDINQIHAEFWANRK
ncbi:DUF2213 domain-containing protein [Paraburkholderia graminis]|uniref:DUF2213 domain-containing protein n=1 Tax=Paraburkholderia graminis TaxID=60548 RepID=UPI0038B7027E